MTAGSASVFPSKSRITARTEPTSPQTSPSSMNGPRMNQFVAPTSFITSISRRRAKIESRIVFAISSVEAITSRITATRKTSEITFAIVRTRFVIVLPHCDAAGRLPLRLGRRTARRPGSGRCRSACRRAACLRPPPASRPTRPATGSTGAAMRSCELIGVCLLHELLQACSFETKLTFLTSGSWLQRRTDGLLLGLRRIRSSSPACGRPSRAEVDLDLAAPSGGGCSTRAPTCRAR